MAHPPSPSRPDRDPDPGPSGGWLSPSARGLIGTQFLGAFNDNLFKTLMLVLFSPKGGPDRQAIAFAVFAIPFILFSGIAGELSERYSKSRTIVWMKVAEVVIMLAAVGAFLLQSNVLLLVTLFVMGTQSAFFGPSKYGILPEFVPPRHLVAVNGVVVMTTFLAILLGQTLAGPVVDQLRETLWVGSLFCVAVALLGVWTATRIVHTPPQAPDTPVPTVGRTPIPFLFAGLWPTYKRLREQPGVLGAITLYCVFFFDAGVVNQAVIAMKHEGCLDLREDQNWIITIGLLGVSSVGIAIGSLLASRLGSRVVPARMVVAGAVAIVAGQWALLTVGPVIPPGALAVYAAMACILTTGIGAGLYSVPLVSFIQRRPIPGHKGRAFAFNNFANFGALFFAAPFYQLFVSLETIPTVAAAAASVVLVLTLVAFRGTLGALRFDD